MENPDAAKQQPPPPQSTQTGVTAVALHYQGHLSLDREEIRGHKNVTYYESDPEIPTGLASWPFMVPRLTKPGPSCPCPEIGIWNDAKHIVNPLQHNK